MLGNSFQRKLTILKNGGTPPLHVRHLLSLSYPFNPVSENPDLLSFKFVYFFVVHMFFCNTKLLTHFSVNVQDIDIPIITI